MYSLSFFVLAITSLLTRFTLALPHAPDDVNAIRNAPTNLKLARTANTCADPSLAEPVYQSFIVAPAVHVLSFRNAFESANSINKAMIWDDLQPAFRAWWTQQEFTVPLFRMGTADRMEYIFRTGVNAQTPPVVSGFTTDLAVVAWVYNSQVCGSIPLMSVAFAPTADHYHTTSAPEHDSFISTFGWADDGVIAFVLPLYDS